MWWSWPAVFVRPTWREPVRHSRGWREMWDGMGHRGSWGDGGWVVMVIMMIVLVLAVAWVVTTMVRHGGTHGNGTSPPMPPTPPTGLGESSARSILDERYARGEIDDDEYQRRRAVLGDGRQP